MRLLNTKSITLEEFFEAQAPPYAILSHTWGDEEVTFQDIQGSAAECTKKAGYSKIVRTCQKAKQLGLDYAWVDTCCIDKANSSELSEAINSMFRWYEMAALCFAYLVDVPPVGSRGLNALDAAAFSRSRWFTRGWTLQELLAPSEMIFYAWDWTRIASRRRLATQISAVTGIDKYFLENPVKDEAGKQGSDDQDSLGLSSTDHLLHQASIAERMSWASRRTTTRPEDMAYCLLGIFGISMPLLYGEGQRAFTRLQEEILRHSDDQSIFAWDATGLDPRINLHSGILAPTPEAFCSSGAIVPCAVENGNHESRITVTNKGIRMVLPISHDAQPYALLQCRNREDPTKILAVRLELLHGTVYSRGAQALEPVTYKAWGWWTRRTIHLVVRPRPAQSRFEYAANSILIRTLPDSVSIKGISPSIPRGFSLRRSPGTLQKSQHGYWERTATVRLANPLAPSDTILDLTLREAHGKNDRQNLIPIHQAYSIEFVTPHGYVAGNRASTITRPSGVLFVGEKALYAKISKQEIFGKATYIVDLHLSSNRFRLLWFRIQDLVIIRQLIQSLKWLDDITSTSAPDDEKVYGGSFFAIVYVFVVMQSTTEPWVIWLRATLRSIPWHYSLLSAPFISILQMHQKKSGSKIGLVYFLIFILSICLFFQRREVEKLLNGIGFPGNFCVNVIGVAALLGCYWRARGHFFFTQDWSILFTHLWNVGTAGAWFWWFAAVAIAIWMECTTQDTVVAVESQLQGISALDQWSLAYQTLEDSKTVGYEKNDAGLASLASYLEDLDIDDLEQLEGWLERH
jgi:hypothetical protein